MKAEEKMRISELAEENYLGKKLNCAESVVKAALEYYAAPECDAAVLLQAAGGFGAGLESGCSCGALTGAVLAAGYLKGNDSAGSAAKKRIAQKIHEGFMAEHKVACCRALTRGIEPSPQRKKQCAGYVRTAARLLAEIYAQEGGNDHEKA